MCQMQPEGYLCRERWAVLLQIRQQRGFDFGLLGRRITKIFHAALQSGCLPEIWA